MAVNPAYGQTFLESQLSHHGVKGMHWGVHRAEKKAARADKKWTKAAGSDKHFFAVHNAAAKRMNNGEIDKFNSQPKYKNADFTHDSPLRRQYYKDYENNFLKVMNEESDKLLGASPDGSNHVEFEGTADGNITFHIKPIKHADDGSVTYLAKKDTKGRIVSVVLVPTEMKHYGVKGMHWGQRKSADAQAAENDVKATKLHETDRRAKVADKLKSKKVIDLNSSKDAREASFVKTKAKISGVNTLSNQDLQVLITRMNLERQFKDLKQVEHEESVIGAGKKWAANFVTDVAKDVTTSYLRNPTAAQRPTKVHHAWTYGQQVSGVLNDPRHRIAIGQ